MPIALRCARWPEAEAVNGYFLLAGVASLAVFATHTFVGGRLFARPLLAADGLHRVVRLTLYYCWHLVTLMLAVMSAAFLFAGWFAQHVALAAAFTMLAAGCSAVSLAIIVHHRAPLLRMPQWAFFAVVALLGVIGLLQ
jgi:hypothetical protein